MKKSSSEKFIFDNAVLSNFARIGKLELIFYVSQNVYTTREVAEELKRGIVKKPKLAAIVGYIAKNKIKELTLEEYDSILLMDQLIKQGFLGVGEISAIVLAQELNGVFITDDYKATRKAIELGTKVLNHKDFNIQISSKNKYKDTVIFLEILKKERVISQREFNYIKNLLIQENFSF